MKVEKIKACPECGSTNVHYSKELDALLCRDCGAEFSELNPEDEKKFEKASDVI